MTIDAGMPGPVERAIAILADLVGFATVSSDSNLALVEYVEALLHARGIASERVLDATGEKASLFAAVGPAGPNGVILSGHTDVVPVTGQAWTTDPFVFDAREARLYGRGTADMKSFLACSLAALECLDRSALRRPVYLAFSYDEEVGCLGAPALLAHMALRVAQPAVAIVGEPSSMRIIASHKSVHLYAVRVTGIPAHSSMAHLGTSANAIAVRLMSTLVRIGDALAADRDATFEPPYTTLTIGVMQGGTAANILAAEASFVFDLRCLPRHAPEEVLRPFFAEAAALRETYPQATIAITAQAAVPPLVARPDGAAEQLVRSVGGDNAATLTASYGAEAGQFQEAGYPTVICGPGSMDQGHQPDEFIEVEQIAQCMRFMERLFAHLSQPIAGA